MQRLTEEQWKAREAVNEEWIKNNCTCGKCRIKTGPYSTVLCGSFECKKKELQTRYKQDKSSEIAVWEELGFKCSICGKTEIESHFKLQLRTNRKEGRIIMICWPCTSKLKQQEPDLLGHPVHRPHSKPYSENEPICHGCGRKASLCNRIVYAKDDQKYYCSSCFFVKSTSLKYGRPYVRLLDRPKAIQDKFFRNQEQKMQQPLVKLTKEQAIKAYEQRHSPFLAR